MNWSPRGTHATIGAGVEGRDERCESAARVLSWWWQWRFGAVLPPPHLAATSPLSRRISAHRPACAASSARIVDLDIFAGHGRKPCPEIAFKCGLCKSVERRGVTERRGNRMPDNSQANHLEVTLPWNEVPTTEDEQVSKRWWISPELLAYLVGPPACVFILILMRFDLVAHESAWLWLGVFIAIPAFSSLVDHTYRARPSLLRLHLRVAVHAAAVSTVIYLCGWGPALSVAFAFIAIENVAHDGSRVWRITAAWSLVGILRRSDCDHRRMGTFRAPGARGERHSQPWERSW